MTTSTLSKIVLSNDVLEAVKTFFDGDFTCLNVNKLNTIYTDKFKNKNALYFFNEKIIAKVIGEMTPDFALGLTHFIFVIPVSFKDTEWLHLFDRNKDSDFGCPICHLSDNSAILVLFSEHGHDEFESIFKHLGKIS